MTRQNICKALFVASFFLGCNAASGQITPVATSPAEHGNYVPWKPIKEIDIAKRRRIWEEITVSENDELFNPNPPGRTLIDLLVAGVINGKLEAFAGTDPRLTHKLTPEEFAAECAKLMKGNSQVTRYIIKEDSLVLNSGEIASAIISVAPVVPAKAADGTITEQPVFWIFYFNSRDYFSSCAASDKLSWDDVLVGRHFTSKVTKATEMTGYPSRPRPTASPVVK